MALNTQVSNTGVNAEADAFAALFNTGYLRIYDGTQPANADTAVGIQVLLAELRFNATAFGASALGVITANAITADSSANNTGTATWFRCLKSDGTTVLMDGSVGLATANMIMNAVAIAAGAAVSCSAFTHTVNKTG